MEPIRLQAKNFLCYSDLDISFADWATAAVIGRIKDNDKLSNGSGKTTIFHAIVYALFNKTHLSSVDKIIRHDTDSCRVIFDFISSLDNQTYRIERGRGKTTGEVKLFKYENDEWIPITGETNKDTEKEISKLIKVNYKTFCNSVLFSHLDLLQGLANLETSKRKILLKEVLQLGSYSKYELAAKKKVSDILKNIEKGQAVLATFGAPLEDVAEFNIELKKIIELLSIENSKISSYKEDYDIKTIEYKTLLNELNELNKQNSEVIFKRKSLMNDIDKISVVIGDYDKKINAIKVSGKSLMDESNKLSSLIKDLGATLASKDKNNLEKTINQLSKDILEYKNVLYSCNTKLQELSIPIPAGGVCKHCRKVITDEDRIACQHQINLDIEFKNNEILTIQKELSKLENTLILSNKEYKLIENIQNNINLYNQKLNLTLKEIESKRALYLEYADIIARNQLNLTEKKAEFSSIGDIASNQELITQITIKSKKIKQIIDNIDVNINRLNESILNCSNKKAVIEHQIKTRLDDVDKLIIQSKKISELEKSYTIHQKVAQAFGPSGVPALIIHTILDDFQIDANNYLGKFIPGLQLRFFVIKDKSTGDQEDTMDIRYFLNGRDLEYDQLSNAQRLIVSLSLKLGLGSIMKKRLGAEIKMLLIDEIDQSLDEGRVEVFEEAIKQLQKEFKILIITHNKDLKDKFNTAILVEQDENFVSTAKVVNNW